MKYELRANQLIGAGGVGAIVDIGDESFAVADITQWGRPSRRITLPRMENRLRRQLYHPPENLPNSHGAVPLKRFPESLFCNRSSCRRILPRWDEGKWGNPTGKPRCPFCGHEGSLVPMRFVAACRSGHMSDVPWNKWVEHTKQECRNQPQLKLLVDRGGTGGLESLEIKCVGCGSKRNLGGIAAPKALKKVGARCLGRHPGVYDPDAKCDEELEVLQRGATNLYYPVTASALALEQASDAKGESPDFAGADDFRLLADMYADAAGSGNFIPPHIEKMITRVAARHQVSVEAVTTLLQQGGDEKAAADGSADDWNEAEILAEEWAFLKSAAAAECSREDLVCRESELPRFKGKYPFDRVLLIKRLREVRAFMGFRRIEPTAALVPPGAGRTFPVGTKPWLPAVEIYGEGIFLSFDEEGVQAWEREIEASSAEMGRLDSLEKVRAESNFWFLPRVSARHIAIHTFSHLLMRQLVFESGYSSSALRERIYAGPGMAGLLIYTADGDSEGSLGGLVRQGQPNRLGDTILLSLDKAQWCSADPVCSETNGQGLGGFNRAACHACSLLPETSCTTANTLLDRGLLLGREGVPGLLGDLF